MSSYWDQSKILDDLHWLASESEERCICDAAHWAHELIYYLSNDDLHESYKSNFTVGQSENDMRNAKVRRTANLGKSLIMKREFHRSMFFFEKIKDVSDYDRFMYYWARFLACENDRLESDAEITYCRTVDDNVPLKDLHNELCDIDGQRIFDVFLLYLLGKVRVSLKFKDIAKSTFLKCIQLNPAFWPAWEELVYLIDSVEEISEILEVNHWMIYFFKADTYFRLQQHKSALDEYEKLSLAGFADMPYLMSQIAASLSCLQEHEMSLNLFQKVRQVDPFRIEQMSLFSDSLYVRGDRSSLASLAHAFYKTHKYNWETCCIVANYYSIRGEHDRAVTFLQRSLKLNPYNSSAWTLIGHEFMEQKNNSAACLAYRRALDIDDKDYRGWYGLGQLYDILKMPSYSLYYYQEAYKCKSDDSRMLVALGEVYLKLNRTGEAKKCFLKAFKVGDVEGSALMLLGNLYVKEKENNQAASVFEKYLEVYGDEAVKDEESLATCSLFLARHYMKTNLDSATPFAQRCLEYNATKEEGRNLLRQISQVHHKLSNINITPPIGGITSTPSAVRGEAPPQLRATQMTPIFPEAVTSTPVPFRAPVHEEGEADMAISSDEDSI